MFLYLGGKTNILSEKVISVHDYKIFLKSQNKGIIEKAKKDNNLILLSNIDKIKSIIITEEKIFLSNISSGTLRKRARKIFYK